MALPLISRNNVAARARPAQGTVRSPSLEVVGGHVLRYGLVAILLDFGTFKFTAVEADAIRPLVANSPSLSWLYLVASVRGASNVIGAVELLIAVLMARRPVAPFPSALGSFGAVAMFVTTLSFLATTPDVWTWAPGFPLPVPTGTGAFLLKDVFLLG
jgi:reactive chlorine resistance protein C